MERKDWGRSIKTKPKATALARQASEQLYLKELSGLRKGIKWPENEILLSESGSGKVKLSPEGITEEGEGLLHPHRPSSALSAAVTYPFL